MTTADVLRAAKARISDPAKWGKGVGRHDKGQECATDAIYEACRDLPQVDEYFKTKSAALLAFKAAINHWSIAVWNDAPQRTHAEVMQAFSVAAESAS